MSIPIQSIGSDKHFVLFCPLFTTVMTPKQPSCLMAHSHCQSSTESEQSLEDGGSVFAHLGSPVCPSPASVNVYINIS